MYWVMALSVLRKVCLDSENKGINKITKINFTNFLKKSYSTTTFVPMLCPGIPVSKRTLKAPELP